MRKYLLLGVVVTIAAFGQQPAFEVASIRSAAQITPEMIQAGKLHVGMKIDAGRVDIGFAVAARSGDAGLRGETLPGHRLRIGWRRSGSTF